MFDHKVMSVVVKEHQKNIFEEVRRTRALRNIYSANPRLSERLFVHLGDLLIVAGLRLRKRYKPTVCSGYKVYQSS
jgi:hypothetical protein